MKVLITGGAGYLGSVLSKQLLDSGHEVIILDLLLYTTPYGSAEQTDRFMLRKGDVADPYALKAAMKGVDAIVHLAGIVGDAACNSRRDLALHSNVKATQILARAMGDYPKVRLLMASSCSVYGKTDGTVVRETSPIAPNSLYSVSKAFSERVILNALKDRRMIVLRLPTMVGPSPRMRFDLFTNRMIASAVCEREIIVAGGDRFRPVLDVRDACRAIEMLLEMDDDDIQHRVYNVGSDSNNCTIEQYASLVSRETGHTSIRLIPDGTDGNSYRVSFERIARLGFTPHFDLRQAIADVAKWLRSNNVEWKAPVYDNARSLAELFRGRPASH